MTRDELAHSFDGFGEIAEDMTDDGHVVVSVGADYEPEQAVHEAENYAALAVMVGGEMHLDATPGTGDVRIEIRKEAHP